MQLFSKDKIKSIRREKVFSALECYFKSLYYPQLSAFCVRCPLSVPRSVCKPIRLGGGEGSQKAHSTELKAPREPNPERQRALPPAAATARGQSP